MSVTTIRNIPLDAWANIMLFVNEQNLTCTFDTLYSSGAFYVTESERLNTFWTLVSLAKLQIQEQNFQEPLLSIQGNEHLQTFKKLCEMGVHKDTAADVIRKGDGSLHSAFQELGWYQA